MELAYLRYIKVKELLSLQQPLSNPPEHDEVLFIAIHQTYEIWFKTLLHEFEKIKQNFLSSEVFNLIHSFKRCRTIMKTLVGQMDILETMTPLSFASFRERLETASGFQSVQYREMEFVLGYKRPHMLKYYKADQESYNTLAKRLEEASVTDCFFSFLRANGVDAPNKGPVIDEKEEGTVEQNEALQSGLLELYKSKPDLRILFELMTDFDEGFQEWRYRHVKLAERTIGNKYGTGGTLGVEFLKRALFKPLFPDLWMIRHKF